MTTQQATPFPLDIEALKPGDVITVAQLQDITQTRHGTDRYQFAIRALASRIEKERKAMGHPIVIRQRKGALEVCDASMQLRYGKRRYEETARKGRRTMTVLVTTSVSELSDEDAKEYERLALNAAARLVAFSRRSPKRIAEDPSSATNDLSAVKARLLSKGKK